MEKFKTTWGNAPDGARFIINGQIWVKLDSIYMVEWHGNNPAKLRHYAEFEGFCDGFDYKTEIELI